ncbi:MAG: hypothetical protein ACO25K_06450 [Candidatus Fonsibacter ubiquis]
MINIQIFITGFKKLQLTFEFEPSTEYQEMVYNCLKDELNDQMFLDHCTYILKNTTKKEWNEAYGYRGRPALKDWLDNFIPEKEEITVYKICPQTGARLVERTKIYPKYYQDFLDSKKLKTLK